MTARLVFDRASASLCPAFACGLVLAAGLAASGCGGQGGGAGDDDDDVAVGDPSCPAADDPGGGVSDVFRIMPAEGSVVVTLHPGPSVTTGSPTVVSFGAPFPRDALSDAGLLRARIPGGAELPIHAEATLPWRVWPGRSGARESVRAAMVSVEVTFPSSAPLAIELDYGVAPTAALDGVPDTLGGWTAVTDGEFPDGTVTEPPVYAAFPADWLSDSVLRARGQVAGADPAFASYDESLVGSAHTAVNDVPDSVTERIDYVTDPEPWLFDRTSTLFGVYARTGDVTWLRHAHRSAQFYLGLVGDDGIFALKPDDLKYSYGLGLLLDFIFTGDPALLDGIERIAGAGQAWDATYDIDTNFWTERHQTYALLAALIAWEASGASGHADRARQVAEASFDLAADPGNGWPHDGCMLHTMDSHEGSGGDVPICSPWMSALFGEAAWEYYLQSGDRAALGFLAELGRYVAAYGVYSGDGEGLDYTVPWYLSSSEYQFSDDGAFGDIEHTCDVGGLVARAAWAKRACGGDPTELHALADDLVESCAANLDDWHRPAGPESGLSEWRLSPPRKFNWWFGTTTDVSWLLDSM